MMKFNFLTPVMWIFFLTIILSIQLFMKETFLIQWTLFNKLNFTFICLFDFITFIFIFTVSLISLSVLIFSKSYMMSDKMNNKFYFTLMLFIFSMILLIISPNNLSMLLGWDGLGVSSYLLVIYYSSNKSNTSGMITLLINRLGDALILSALALHSQELYWFTDHMMLSSQIKMSSFLMVLGLMTKSAQLPFSSWLPAAMAAPTPVSSLVHSSTLVTAGIYLMIRMTNLFKKININVSILFLGTLTTTMASLLAMKENDMKKVVALSTLSQLGFMVSMLGLNCWLLAFSHLINHAFFKALLFISTGNMIHSSNDSQDLKLTGSKKNKMFNSFIMVVITSLSMTGLTFLSAFYVKEVMVENMTLTMSTSFLLSGFLLTLFLTPIYTMRSLNIFYFSVVKSFTKTYSENSDHLVQTSMHLLLIPTFISGFLLNKNFVFKEEASINTSTYGILALMMILITFFLYFLLQFKSILNFVNKNIFKTTMWGVTQLYMNLFPIIANFPPQPMLLTESKILTYAFNFMGHEMLSRTNTSKLFFNVMLLTSIITLLGLNIYYLNNKMSKL